MNTLVKVLDEKLKLLGYNENLRSTVISKLDISLVENKLNDVEDYAEYIDVFQFDEPCIEITMAFLNINNRFIQSEVLEGNIWTVPTENIFKESFVVAEYRLDKRVALISISNDFRIKIYIYSPTQRNQTLYAGKTYNNVFKKLRDDTTKEYKEAFEKKNIGTGKIEDILSILVLDYIIDDIIVNDLNPRIKMYDDPYKYANNITSYSLRYVNNRTNRIEVYEKEPNIRRISDNLKAGTCSNDPYIRLDEMPLKTDFPLKEISYCWLNNVERKQDEIGIYIATRGFEYRTFLELKMNSIAITKKTEEIVKILKRTERIEEEYTPYVREIIMSLNMELVIPPIEVIKSGLENQFDTIIPITYRYEFVTNPKEFEEKLYVSIEDNIGRNYKYKITENIMEDLTRIGNKLEYTDETGEQVRRQSIADFNVNAPTAIIRKETFIDQSGISDLLCYIYHDLDSYGTDKLPIPSIYVEIYIPKRPSKSACMYNGTSLDFTLEGIKNGGLSYNSSENNDSYIEAEGEIIPGSTYVTVRYINSKGEVLKENKIGNLMPGSIYIPEHIPVINDAKGREWRAELVKIDSHIVQEQASLNIINLKYIERYTRVKFSYINREGKKIADEKQEIVQVGENYDFENKKIFTDKNNDEWHLKFSRPTKLIAKDNEEKNVVILVYDIERADILVSYISKNNGQELLESKRIVATADKKYTVEVPSFVIDSSGFGWNYVEGTETSIFPKKDVLNEVKLCYEEAKVPVTISAKNNKNVKLVNDKVELVQSGKKFKLTFDEKITDLKCREWVLKSENKNVEIVVDKDKEKNIISAIYEPLLANVTVKFVNSNNKTIRNDKIEKAQIGEVFDSESLEEIVDNFGKVWKCVDKGERIVVKDKEIENLVTLKYEPLMGKIMIKYLDIELNQLIEPKFITLQVGTVYKDRPIEKLTSKDGKHWMVEYSKIKDFTVKKHEEENTFTIYYDKENAGVELGFFDAYGHELTDAKTIYAQIGAEVGINAFEKITAKDGMRWMLVNSEPKNLITKESNNFVKLIYDELKVKVLLKHIDVKSQKTIVENIMSLVKLGGIYSPNLRSKVLDKNKYSWKYIGDENISIVTKENEQENIIILNYEEDTANVILKYENETKEKIREDAVKQVQIGKEIKIDPILKFSDNTGLMWTYKSTKQESKIVEEKDNIIYVTYEPVIADIKIRYTDGNENDVINPKMLKVQVGKEFKPEIINRVTDKDGKVWVYSKISEEKIIVKEETNEITMKFEKLMSKISVQLLDEASKLIAEPIIYTKQVGDIFKVKYETTYTDFEDKLWTAIKVDKEEIRVSEAENKNIINVAYIKEMINVQLAYLDNAKNKIRANTTEKAQVGSIYKTVPFKEIIDEKTGLGWKTPDDLKIEYKVKKIENENLVEIEYEELKAKTIVKFNDAMNNEILDEMVYSEQVGTTFAPKIEQTLVDKQDKEWLYGITEEAKLFAGNRNKIESIVISKDIEKNCIVLKYRPSLIKVTIKYQEPLGNKVKADDEVEAQIGSIYEAEILENIIDSQRVKWVYNPNSKTSIKVSSNEDSNVIIMGYEEEKALVTYKYHDEEGNRLRSPKRKLVQIGSVYEPEIDNIIEDFQGKVWEYKARSVNRLEIKEEESTNIIEVIYTPLKVDTILRFINLHGKQIMKDVIVKAQLKSEFAPNIQEKITDENSRLYKFIKITPDVLKIQEVPAGALESPNVFEITYEAVYSDVTTTYKTIDGKSIKKDEMTQLQVGTIYDPIPIRYVKDSDGIQWELIAKDIDSIRIKEDSRENIVSMVYEVAKAELTIRYVDMDGNRIYPSDVIQMEVGKKYVPKVKEELVDENNKKWSYAMVNPVRLTVGSINNVITATYQEKKMIVTIKFQTKDGKKLKEDMSVKVQAGIMFEPKDITKVIYDENEIWRFQHNEPSSILVSDNVSENVITQIYTKEEVGMERKAENQKYYNPEVEKFVDQELVEKARREDEEKSKVQVEKEEEVILEDENLKTLERSIALKNTEKSAINKLNQYNKKIVEKLNSVMSLNSDFDDAKLDEELNEIMVQERQTIQEGLIDIIDDDKSGKKMLKIFETITSKEISNKNLYLAQQRKIIAITDYFISKQVSDAEQATYICEKGKTEKEIECLNEEIPEAKNLSELLQIKMRVVYEKAILNNYYKARSKAKDEYFKDESSKSLISPNVMIIVTNMLPKQAYNLILKLQNISAMQQIELEALVKLMNSQQLSTLSTLLEKIPDGKIRKQALKILKELQ